MHSVLDENTLPRPGQLRERELHSSGRRGPMPFYSQLKRIWLVGLITLSACPALADPPETAPLDEGKFGVELELRHVLLAPVLYLGAMSLIGAGGVLLNSRGMQTSAFVGALAYPVAL